MSSIEVLKLNAIPSDDEHLVMPCRPWLKSFLFACFGRSTRVTLCRAAARSLRCLPRGRCRVNPCRLRFHECGHGVAEQVSAGRGVACEKSRPSSLSPVVLTPLTVWMVVWQPLSQTRRPQSSRYPSLPELRATRNRTAAHSMDWNRFRTMPPSGSDA